MNKGSKLIFSHAGHPSNYRQNGCYYVNLPTMDYEQAWNLQKELVAARNANTIDMDIALILDHSPVFTTGRRGGHENLMVSKDFLKKSGIKLVQVERGGNITFHGPGQLVIYLIINLRANRLTVTDYVCRVEDVMLRTVAEWGITARRHSMNRGIWVDQKKLGSVGIAIRRGISFHGIALNVNTSLEPFTWINPCGLKGIQVTSMAQESDQNVSMKMVQTSAKRHIEAVFGFRLLEIKLPSLLKCLQETKAA